MSRMDAIELDDRNVPGADSVPGNAPNIYVDQTVSSKTPSAPRGGFRDFVGGVAVLLAVGAAGGGYGVYRWTSDAVSKAVAQQKATDAEAFGGVSKKLEDASGIIKQQAGVIKQGEVTQEQLKTRLVSAAQTVTSTQQQLQSAQQQLAGTKRQLLSAQQAQAIAQQQLRATQQKLGNVVRLARQEIAERDNTIKSLRACVSVRREFNLGGTYGLKLSSAGCRL